MRPPEPRTTFTGREWAFRRVGEWLAGNGSCLVVTGRPGAGKTAFAAQLAAMAAGEVAPPAGCARPVFHAVHRCQQQEFASIDPIRVIEQLAYGLALSVPGYSDALVMASAKDPGMVLRQTVHRAEPGSSITLIGNLVIGERNPRRVWDQIIRSPFEVLTQQGRLGGDAVILIDGLDEAVEGFAGFHLARLLAEERLPAVPQLRFLLTTRPGQAADLLRKLIPWSGFDLSDDQPPGVDDIQVYVRRKIGDPGRATEIARASEGSFLYAVHVVEEYLATGHFAYGKLPPGLAAFYEAFLDRHIGADPASWRAAYRPVLGVIAEAQHPGLTRQQIIAAVGGHAVLHRGITVDDVIYDCYPHLDGNLPDGPFRVGHRSLREYLRTPGGHFIHPIDANNAILAALVQEVGGTDPRDWSTASAYSRAHLLVHAFVADRADEFLTDLRFLLHANAASLAATLGKISSPVAQRAAHLCGRNPQRLSDDTADRRGTFYLNALAHGLHSEAERLLAETSQGTLSHALRWATNNGDYEVPSGTGWISANGHPQVVAGDDTAVVLYDLDSGAETASVELPDGASGIAVLSSDVIAVSGYHESVEVFDAAALDFVDSFMAHPGFSSGLGIGSVGDRVFVLSVGNDSPVFHGDPGNLASFVAFEVMRGPGQAAVAIVFEKLDQVPFAFHCAQIAGGIVAVFQRGDEIQLWSIPQWTPFTPPIKVGSAVTSLYLIDIPGAGTHLAVGSSSGEALVYSMPDHRSVFRATTPTSAQQILLLPSTRHGFLLLTGSAAVDLVT